MTTEQKKDIQSLKDSLGPKKTKKLSLKKARAGKKRLKDYGKVLLAKQLLRALYNNPRERTFKKYFVNTNSMTSVFEKLNSRLDVVLTAMGGALSNKHAKQLINHGKITVNGHVVKERGYLLKDGDIIASAVNFVDKTKKQLESFSLYNLVHSATTQDLSLKVASLKPQKIPSYLNLQTPIFASLFVNSKLNYGIYYSKKINLNDPSDKGNLSEGFGSDLVVAQSDSFKSVGTLSSGLGWKNTNVKSIKTLLLDLKQIQLQTLENTESLGQRSQASSEKRLDHKGAEEKIKKIYSVLYSLVQAYYSRKH